ncbi:hypothetical protein EIP91_000098 [Steccherinum ochraceum]|uniref:Protein kinase domain-containing protein n=1 Tax=Steccherinum ochraceum TaxID=92696 RepID=A0A4R0RV26_9APHY|nr:hypothetical protein EIP91_000098 [Steccherinum ochraceum]
MAAHDFGQSPPLQIRDLVHTALGSSGPDIVGDAQAKLLQLSGGKAQEALDLVWETLKAQPAIPGSPRRSPYLQLASKLALKNIIFPSSFNLSRVRLKERPDFNPLGGAYGLVYRGEHGLNTAVALKVMRPPDEHRKREDTLSPDQAICREALLWMNLNHPHVLRFLGLTRQPFRDRKLCMVSPWMDRGSILDHLPTRRRVSQGEMGRCREVLDEWLFQIALGLEYLHINDIVHGDLWGANILLDASNNIRISDFGLSLIAHGPPYKQGSPRGGNTAWTAPELLDPEKFGMKGRRPAFTSDVYSFGCVCVELYTGGKCLFPNLNPFQNGSRAIAGVKPPKPALMSTALWDLVLVCLGLRTLRPTAHQLAVTLNRWSLLPVSVSEPQVPMISAGRRRPPALNVRRELERLFSGSDSEEPDEGARESTLDSSLSLVPLSESLRSIEDLSTFVGYALLDPEEVERWQSTFGNQEEVLITSESLLLAIIHLPWTIHAKHERLQDEPLARLVEIVRELPEWGRTLFKGLNLEPVHSPPPTMASEGAGDGMEERSASPSGSVDSDRTVRPPPRPRQVSNAQRFFAGPSQPQSQPLRSSPSPSYVHAVQTDDQPRRRWTDQGFDARPAHVEAARPLRSTIPIDSHTYRSIGGGMVLESQVWGRIDVQVG